MKRRPQCPFDFVLQRPVRDDKWSGDSQASVVSKANTDAARFATLHCFSGAIATVGRAWASNSIRILPAAIPPCHLAKTLQRWFSNIMDLSACPAPRPPCCLPEDSWTFRPDIGCPNIRSKLPENIANMRIAGQSGLLIKVSQHCVP